MVRFFLFNKKWGLIKVIYFFEGFFYFIFGFGILEMFYVMVIGKFVVRFLEGILGFNVNFGVFDRMNEMNVNLDFVDFIR